MITENTTQKCGLALLAIGLLALSLFPGVCHGATLADYTDLNLIEFTYDGQDISCGVTALTDKDGVRQLSVCEDFGDNVVVGERSLTGDFVNEQGLAYTATFNFSADKSTLTGTIEANGNTIPVTGYRINGFEEHLSDGAIPLYWYSRVPDSVVAGDTVPIIVSFPGSPNDDNDNYNGSIGTAFNDIFDAIKSYPTDCAILVPIIPRSNIHSVYGPMLTRASFVTDQAFYLRPDLTVVKQIEALRTSMTQAGLKVPPKVLVAGYSAGGSFGVRFAAIHPDKVHAVASGGAGGYLWPLSSYSGEALTFPVGVSDLTALTGSSFDESEFKTISMFLFSGALDDNACWGGDCYTADQMNQIDRLFGTNQVSRLQSMATRMTTDLGMDATYQSYAGVAHDYTDAMRGDVKTFFNANRPPLDGPVDQAVIRFLLLD